MKKLPKSFIISLIISLLIWLIINMSRSYVQVITIPVEFVHLPQNKLFLSEPIKELNIEVLGTGFNFFSSNFSQSKIKIPLDKLIHKDNNTYTISSTDIFKNIEKQLTNELRLKRIINDDLNFDIGKLATKKVALIPNFDIKYSLGFDKTKVEIIPDSVTLSGTKSSLDNVKNIKLKELKLNDVSEDISISVPIIKPKNLKINFQKAKLNITVDKVTEGEFNIPIKIKNLNSEKIKIYPDELKVVFKVGLKDFSKISPNSFKIVADYNFSKKNELTYLIPKLIKKPNSVSIIRIIPNKVDFLINK